MELVDKFNETRDMNPLYYLYRGNKFNFPTNKLIENQKRISGTKRDMRRKFIKSDRPTYNQNRIVNKAEEGMKFSEFEPIEAPRLQDIYTTAEIADILIREKSNSEFDELKQFSTVEELLGMPQEEDNELVDIVDNLELNDIFVMKPVAKSSNKTSTSFNIEAATQYLTEHANNSSVKACAKYVRKALEAGGLDTTGHPVSAADYSTYLPKLGFDLVSDGYGNKLPSNYTPKKGDIVVIDRVGKHKHGHIAMYNGHQWISDFKQKGFQVYDTIKDYTIWRHK